MHANASLAGHLYDQRRTRDRVFGDMASLFADPAWDILLDLVRHSNGTTRISVSSACIAASVPLTTALRHIRALEERGLIQRVADRSDRRRQYLQITDDGHELMAATLAAGLKSLGPADPDLDGSKLKRVRRIIVDVFE